MWKTENTTALCTSHQGVSRNGSWERLAWTQTKIPVALESARTRLGTRQEYTTENRASSSKFHYEDFSILSFMTTKEYEWVELYDKEQLFTCELTCVKSCLNCNGFHEYGLHLLSLTPRPLSEMRTYDNRPIHSLPWGNSTALEYFLRYEKRRCAEPRSSGQGLLVFQYGSGRPPYWKTRTRSSHDHHNGQANIHLRPLSRSS